MQTVIMLDSYGPFKKDQIVEIIEVGYDWVKAKKKGMYIPAYLVEIQNS